MIWRDDVIYIVTVSATAIIVNWELFLIINGIIKVKRWWVVGWSGGHFFRHTENGKHTNGQIFWAVLKGLPFIIGLYCNRL